MVGLLHGRLSDAACWTRNLQEDTQASREKVAGVMAQVHEHVMLESCRESKLSSVLQGRVCCMIYIYIQELVRKCMCLEEGLHECPLARDVHQTERIKSPERGLGPKFTVLQLIPHLVSFSLKETAFLEAGPACATVIVATKSFCTRVLLRLSKNV